MREDSQPAAEPGLRRELQLLDAVGIGLGAIIGAGLFVVTGIAAGAAGPAFLVGLVLAGAAAACNALSSAQLAAAIPESGGTYEYGYRLLNPWMGFAAGWMFLISKLAAAGVVALGFEAAVRAFAPNLPTRIPAVIMVAVLTCANLLGIKKAGHINSAIVAVTIGSLVVFVAAGIGHFRTENLQPFAPGGVRGILESSALLFFAFTGYARVATLGEEVHDPKRTIPRAIILALISASVLYTLVSLVAVGAVGPRFMASSQSPIVDSARSFGIPVIPGLVMAGAAAAMLGVLLSQLLGVSRMILAMARRRDLPHGLSRIQDSSGAPVHGVLASGLIAGVIASIGTLPLAAASASFAILIYYAIANLAALKQPEPERLYPRWISQLGLAICILLSVSLKPLTITSGVAILSIGLVGRWLALKMQGGSKPGI